MTRSDRRIAVFLLPALSAVGGAALGVSGCLGSGCALGCSAGGAFLPVPTMQSVTIENIDAHPPCRGQTWAGDDGGLEVYVRAGKAATCQVRVTLSNGDVYTTSVEFRVDQFACCPAVFSPADASPLERAEASAG